MYFCRKHRPAYETIALTPRKYWATMASTSGAASRGWYGDPETNIPALLFPKHVLGLHASDDLAFHRDFEAVHSASRRLTAASTVNGAASNGCANGLATANGSAAAASSFPDILNGGRGMSDHTYSC